MRPQLRNVNEEPDARVVRLLESALLRAQSGELRSVVVAGELTGNGIYSGHETSDIIKLLGLIELMKGHITAKNHANGEEV